MNKILTFGLIGLLAFFGFQYFTDNKVQEQVADVVDEVVDFVTNEDVVDYLSFNGTIIEVRENSILVENNVNEEDRIVFNISADTLLLSDDTKSKISSNSFVVGQEITAFYPENTPMALSLPPILTPQVIVVNAATDVGFVHVATFDEKLVSSDGSLKLNLSSSMTIVDRQGQPVTSVANKTLVVFYSVSTRSIPAQTIPEKIIVL